MRNADKDAIFALCDFINQNFKEVHKSPYSKSFYNKEVDWGYKPEGVIRISDHWNFLSHDEIHCATHQEINNDSLSIGMFEGDKFNIIESYNKDYGSSASVGDRVYRLYIDNKGSFVSDIVIGQEPTYAPGIEDRRITSFFLLSGY
ncbi:hypothetical protein [Paenibacillus endoradicis]|uniref:hypothetical protein n=1 Tax=Paenibacillus endoradicis TaxID=2972487 RepID=UPI002158C00C|nr:hypothetical protein [Paenibacillus endoradicis]MCR8656380.1 hypothetical protein [Paenibacillus endoradicis]